jgi:metallo-beta-lactamase family protein
MGPRGIPILRDFEPFQHADLVFLESMYGDRDHRLFVDSAEEFVCAVKEAVASGGKILVPTFAIGRTQLLEGLLGWMFRRKRVVPLPIFLDSPMAIEATRIYTEHRELFDDDMQRFISEHPLRDDLVTLKVTATANESIKINEHKGPCLILAGSGMCNAGRIVHHLKHNLWRKETHILFVGYQGQNSLRRRIVDGQPIVSIHGERIVVRGQVHTLGGVQRARRPKGSPRLAQCYSAK